MSRSLRLLLSHAGAIFLIALAACASPRTSVTAVTAASTRGDPLPSWNDGEVKGAILDYLDRVSTPGSADFVPVDERIAVFDNDGTLWQEKPLVEGAFTIARLREMAERDPALRHAEPFASALTGDLPEGRKAILELATRTHTGMTDEAYEAYVRAFLASARHPRFGVPYTSLTYAPMMELLRLLRARGFTVYLSSAGDVDFMRVFADALYGVPKERVIGSRFDKKLVTIDRRSTFMRLPAIETVNDGATKPDGIDRRVGRRPIFAAGNEGNAGDIEMLEYTRDAARPSMALVIKHDDAIRETAYSEKDGATPAAALSHDFRVVSMKRDWNTVFAASDASAAEK
ncbi:MAG: haloacid dehalogenase-like hydrolase [Labilithrix sp.]|nr:haloacid dehalogenase-like hydrolase [Labilithrix sp.]